MEVILVVSWTGRRSPEVYIAKDEVEAQQIARRCRLNGYKAEVHIRPLPQQAVS